MHRRLFFIIYLCIEKSICTAVVGWHKWIIETPQAYQ